MNPANLCRCLLWGVLLPASFQPAALAQPRANLTLDDIVARLQSNLDEYERSVPSFLADERIDSIMRQFAQRGAVAPNYETIAESVFRMKRNLDPAGNTVSLDESREIRTIDGKPANGRDIDAPAMVVGAFSGGLAFVSKEEQACSRYTLEPVKPRKNIVVRFAYLPAQQRPKDCILTEDGSGSVTIDPASMQIVRIEIKVPHHVVTPHFHDGSAAAPIMTQWKVRIAYKPVVLNARTFWLPATITSLCSNDRTEWFFRGAYRNYHLLEVHSRILIPGETSER